MNGFWLADERLVLASRSKARLAMLTAAGVPVDVAPAAIDEHLIQAEQAPRTPAAGLASILSEAKAKDVSTNFADRLVLGCDQTLEFDGNTFFKAESRAEARIRLNEMAGRTHRLHSGYCFVRNGRVENSGVRSAELKMRTLSPSFIDSYLDAAGDHVLGSVGLYELESFGAQLFDWVQGDWFTILGLPLLEVLAHLRASKILLE